jgi:diguanylate cyclase (GGDEF)-like protein
MAEWRRGGEPPSVLLVQVNDYHGIVSCHGDMAGQMIVRAMSRFLGAAVRDSDLVARYEGSVFAMLLPGIKAEPLIGVADRLRRTVAQCSLPLETGPVRFTVSMGAAQANPKDDAEQLLTRAREALELANRTGGNVICLHNGEACKTIPSSTTLDAESVG